MCDFSSDRWWACLIEEKLRNYETAMRRHTADSLHIPASSHGLPSYADAPARRDDSEGENDAASDGQSEPSNAEHADLGALNPSSSILMNAKRLAPPIHSLHIAVLFPAVHKLQTFIILLWSLTFGVQKTFTGKTLPGSTGIVLEMFLLRSAHAL